MPNVLLTTIDPLAEVGVNGDFTLIQARVVRRKQDSSGETLANELSDVSFFPNLANRVFIQAFFRCCLLSNTNCIVNWLPN